MKKLRVLTYASGNLGKAFIINVFEISLLFFLTDLMGMQPLTAGIILCLTLIADAFLTAAIGFTSDGLNLRHYRAGTLILTGAPLCFMSLGLLFALPILHIRSLPLVFALILASRLSFILIDLPYSALTPRIEPESHRRTGIEAAKYGFMTLGTLLFSFVVVPALNFGKNPHIEQTLVLFGLICGGIGPLLVVLAWFAVRRFDRDPTQGNAPRPPQARTFRHMLFRVRALWHRDFITIFGVIALIPYTSHLFLKSLAYEATYVIGDVDATGKILAAMVAGQILGLPLWPRLARRMEKARTVQCGLSLMIIALCLFCALPHIPGMLILCAGLLGVGICGLIPLIWSMAGDCVDLSFARSGVQCRTYGFGMLSFAAKISLGVSTLLFTLALQYAGYNSDGTMPHTAVTMIRLLNGLLPAGVAGLCLILLSRYHLTYRRHREIAEKR